MRDKILNECEDIIGFVCDFARTIILLFTFPTWIIPYLIYKKVKNDNDEI